MKEELGKWLIDIAKLLFAGIILIGVMKSDSIDEMQLFGVGGTKMDNLSRWDISRSLHFRLGSISCQRQQERRIIWEH